MDTKWNSTGKDPGGEQAYLAAAQGGADRVEEAEVFRPYTGRKGQIRAVLAFRSTNRLCQRIYAFCAGVWNGFASLTRMKKKGWFLLYSIGIWVCYWFMCVMIAMAFPAVGHIGVMDALLIMAAGSLSSLVPAPGGFGTYHYFVTLTLSGLFGVPWDTGIIYATLSHESQALNMIVAGSLGYLYLLLARKRPGRRRT